MKKRGFTLVELLAVIVILAAIALIATPIVTKVIDQSEKEAAERSAENYIKAVDIAIAAARLDDKVEDGQYTIKAEENKLCLSDDKCLTVEVNGNKPSGTITIKDEEVVTDSTTALKLGDYIVSYDENGKLTSTKGDVEEVNFKTVYSWSNNEILDGSLMDSSVFTTNPSTLEKNNYLKHILDEENKVKESYVCTKNNDDEICLRGGAEHYTENKAIIESLCSKGFTCNIDSSKSECYNDNFILYASPDGTVTSYVGADTCYGYGNNCHCENK